MTESIVHVHSSSRYSRSPESLRRAIQKYIRRDNADIITFTEVADSPREKPLYAFPGWGALTGDVSRRNDAGIMWNEKKFKVIESFNHEIATKTFFTKKGYHFPPVAATSVILESLATGQRFLASVAHFPPTVMGTRGFQGPSRRIAAWHSALYGWRKFWNSQRDNVDAIMVVADWNLDLRKPWVRTYFRQSVPKMNLVWNERFPSPHTGTTGRGLIIDFTLIRGQFVRKDGPTILPDDNSSDHRPYKETLSLLPAGAEPVEPDEPEEPGTPSTPGRRHRFHRVRRFRLRLRRRLRRLRHRRHRR